jgi:hypothetical protein
MGYEEYLKEMNNDNEPTFSSDDKFYYAYKVKGLKPYFELGDNKTKTEGRIKANHFMTTTKSYEFVDPEGKGEKSLNAIKKWVKEFKPKEFYATWQKNSMGNFDEIDDGIKVYYKK